MHTVRTCANTVDCSTPNPCLIESMVNIDKNQLNFGHSLVTLGALFRVTSAYLGR
jgi:hypothetical protein